MARRRKGGRRQNGNGLGLGRILSVKNVALTVGAAVVAPRLGVSSQLGGAVGGFMGAGLMGAVAGYLLGAPAASAIGGALGGTIGGGQPVY